MQHLTPFNPILGETLQLHNPDTGTMFFGEQICHHPPIGFYQIDSADGSFTMNGNIQIHGTLAGIDSFKGKKKGRNIISFSDGGLYSYDEFSLLVEGLMKETRLYNLCDRATIKDHINKLHAEIIFDP